MIRLAHCEEKTQQTYPQSAERPAYPSSEIIGGNRVGICSVCACLYQPASSIRYLSKFTSPDGRALINRVEAWHRHMSSLENFPVRRVSAPVKAARREAVARGQP